jgi:DNA polymerase III subunit delta
MLFFLYGEDSFRSSEKVLEIKNKFQLNDKSGAGLSSFDGREEKNALVKIEATLKNTGLFSEKKLLILKGTISHSPTEEQTKILAFLKKNIESLKNNSDLVIIFWEETTPRKNNALFKFLLVQAKKQNFEKLIGIKLNEWALEKIKKSDSGAKISAPALNKLIAYTGGNSAIISQEIEKLINFSYGKTINESAIDLLVRSQGDSDIFKTIEALASKNKRLALKLLRGHIDRGDDPFYLFSMFIYQFRNLLRISALQENGLFNEFEIAKITKLHPYVVKKSFSDARSFGSLKLKNIYAELCLIDTKIKTGKIDAKLALDKFIGEL